MENNRLIMPFTNQSHSYTEGFECGQIWEMMGQNKKFNSFIFNTNNTEQVSMMCRQKGYSFVIKKIDNFWSELTAEIIN